MALWGKNITTIGFRYIASSSDGANVVGVTSTYIYRSTDYGMTWSQTGAPSKSWYRVVSSASGSVLAATAIGEASTVYISTNSGASWTPRTISTAVISSMYITPSSSHLVVAGNSIWVTYNQGSTWEKRNPTTGWNIQSIVGNSDCTKLSLNSGSSMYTSTDLGTTLVNRGALQLSALSASSDCRYIIGAVTYGPLYRSTDYGVTFSQVKTGQFFSVGSSSTGSNFIAGSRNFDVVTSIDYGVTWSTEVMDGAEALEGWCVASDNTGTKLVATPAGPVYNTISGNTKIAVNNTWKSVTAMYVASNAVWKMITDAQLSIGSTWKDLV